MLLSPGDEIERYRVEALLGRGAMAEVYRVRHRTLKTAHALKVLMLTGARVRERLIQEGQVQATIKHPNVLAVTDVLDVSGSPGLLMELVEGPSLDEWIREARPDLPEAERMFRGVLSGVGEAHAMGLVHRDLKPANVLVARHARGPVPKVADFGLAKVLADAESGGMQRTRSGSALGTPSYMAPEQIRDAKRVDHRADIFSLGCILYELCTGVRPFDGDDLLSVFNKVASGRYEPVPHLPERVQRAIAGALITDREARIPSCEVLEEVLAGTRTAWERPPMLLPPLETVAPGTGETLVPVPLERAAGAPVDVGGTWADDEDDVAAAAAPEPAAPAVAPTLAPLGGELGVQAAEPAPRAAPPPPPPAPPAPRPAPVDSMMSMELQQLPSVSLPAPEAAPAPAPAGSSRWVAVVGAVALVALGVGGWVWSSGGGTPAEPVEDPSASAPAPVPVPDPAPPPPPVPAGEVAAAAPVGPAAVPTAPIRAPAPSAPAAVKPADKAPKKPEPAAAAPAPEPPKAPAAASASGRLTIMTRNPAGTIVVDGKTFGSKFKDQPFSAGSHAVELRSPDGKVARRTLTVPADGVETLCWDFELDDTCM